MQINSEAVTRIVLCSVWMLCIDGIWVRYATQTPDQLPEDNMLRWEVNYLAPVLTVCDRGQLRSTLPHCRATEDDRWQNRSKEREGTEG